MTGSSKAAGPCQFMVGDAAASCDWRWPDAHPVWQMSSKEGVQWYPDGPLTEDGRTLILKHFGLDTIADKLPLEVLKEMSPEKLVAKRRLLEMREGYPHLEIVSNRIGGRVFAEQAA
jgi:hypothetical protein